MSKLNEPKTAKTFEIIREYLKGAVPPCSVETDEPHHIEVVANDGTTKHIFGYCVEHNEVVTVGFDTKIPENALREIFSERLIKMMNEHRRIELRNIEQNDLHKDLQDAFEKLLYYFNEKNWTKA